MVVPPSTSCSLEGGDQLLNGGEGQDGGFRTWFGGEVGASDGNVADPIRENFDLAVTDMSRKASES